MSLYGMLRTGVSGMNAQSNLLGTVSDNIANSGTIGYKRADTQFSSLLLNSGKGSYNPGAVKTDIRHAISDRGPLTYTTSNTDLAVQGNGFFVVNDPNGNPYLTRAGAFTLDGNTGNLVNTAGFTLMGYDISGGDPGVVLNGLTGLQPVNFGGMNMTANPTTSGVFKVNLPDSAEVVTGNLPSANAADSAYTAKSSITVFDKVGNEVTLDIYMSKTSDSPAEWEYTVYDHAGATDGGFPYASAALSTQTVTFDDAGALTSTPAEIALTVPGGEAITLDLTGTTHLAAEYTPMTAVVNGNAPATIKDVTISEDGTVYANYTNGAMTPAFRLPLADVPSPDKLEALSGNVFSVTLESGAVEVGFPTEGSRGAIVSGALEQSNVDMASELTDMIVAQRDYSANSKVFQTGSELLDVLMNLKR
ncbi:flagellar hook protein FlgE [Afifella sp. JA880]|uniref:flagellar hook protein FlgE n=1 Tax=Afifella sp. JA880 TaxID=2975280 RepID=UPI0021BB611D|nr:flagellar hook protein FlgE [Afifella sp. JA880]MCT8267849.1 flagellar hook protein FlgE [Afifella sp. JA880]